MAKRVFAALICVILTLAMGVNCFANGNIINITKPEGDADSTFKKTYVICGNTDKEDVTVELSVYSKSSDSFVAYNNTEGESSWTIGSSGMFMKEISLPNYGANRIKIVAYKSSDPEKKQVEEFTITLLKEALKDKIIDGTIVKLNDAIKQIFKK